MTETCVGEQLAIRHACRNEPSVACHGWRPGRPRRRGCPVCHGPWYVQTGVYAVVLWRGDSRYGPADAVGMYTTEHGAQRCADRLGGMHVVRWLPVASAV